MFPVEPSGYKSCFVYFIKTTHLYQLHGRRQHCLTAFSTVSCLANVGDVKQLHWIIRYWQFREQLGDFAITMRILLWIPVYLFFYFFINFGPLRWAVGAPWSFAWCHYNTAVPFSAVCTLNSKTHPQYLTALSSACWLFIQSWTFCHTNNGTLARQSLDSGSPKVFQLTCERKTKHPTSRTASLEEK